MNSYLRALLVHLRHRCETLRGRLQDWKHHPDIEDYRDQIVMFLLRVEQEAEALLADQDFGATQLLPDYLQKYRGLAQRVQLIEWFPIPAVVRYDDTAHHFFTLIDRVLRQINCPLPPPIPSVYSHGYYWAQPVLNIIGIPISEEYALLSLPDLFHELGHILLARQREDLIGNFEAKLTRHFAEERRRVETGGRAPQYAGLYDRIESQWKDYWLSEYTCDMVAAYWVGPAYGWAHLRLCMSSLTDEMFGPDLDDSLPTHPSDESRYRAIMAIFQPLQPREDLNSLEERWHDYVALTGYTPPMDYDLCYPQPLIDALADRLIQGCRELGLRSFTEHPESEGEVNISRLLNAAWQRFRAEQDTYPLWEQDQMRRLNQWLETELTGL